MEGRIGAGLVGLWAVRCVSASLRLLRFGACGPGGGGTGKRTVKMQQTKVQNQLAIRQCDDGPRGGEADGIM